MSSHYRLLSQLDSCLELLVTSTSHLLELMQEDQSRCWLLGHQTTLPGSPHLAQALTDFWQLPDQDGRTTRSYPGLIACSAPVWEQLGSVNYCKVAFSGCIDALRREKPEALEEICLQLAARYPELHRHLAQDQPVRLHLKQTWRQIQGCPTPLHKVHFSWYTNGRSIRRVSHKEVSYLLQKARLSASQRAQQLALLASLPPDEPLAQVQKQAPQLRANLFFHAQLPGLPSRRAINLSMPLFVLSEERELPPFNPPSLQPSTQRKRARRSDSQLQEEAFLPSLRIYRYIDWAKG